VVGFLCVGIGNFESGDAEGFSENIIGKTAALPDELNTRFVNSLPKCGQRR
jgi:hypothetical protein